MRERPLETLFLLFFFPLAHAQAPLKTIAEGELVKNLFDGYDNRIRPVRSYHDTLHVIVEMELYSLIEVDELDEQIKLLLWDTQSWIDQRLVWNPRDHGGVSYINIPIENLWAPDGAIFNSVKVEDPFPIDVIISPDGRVEADYNKLIEARCPMNVVDFPFDKQLCSFQFGSWSYTHDLLVYNATEVCVRDESAVGLFENSEWKMLSFIAEPILRNYSNSVGQNTTYEEIFYRLVNAALRSNSVAQKIQRKPLYYIYVMLIPTFVIVCVSIVGLFTPHGSNGEREEKVNFGLTTLLTMAVILGVVTQEMPKSSQGMPILGRFVLAEIVVSVVGIFVTVIIIFAHEHVLCGPAEPPRWICLLFCVGGGKSKVHDQKRSGSANGVGPKWVHPLLASIVDDVQAMRKELRERVDDERKRVIWQKIFTRIDIFLMILMLIVNAIVCVSILRHYISDILEAMELKDGQDNKKFICDD